MKKIKVVFYTVLISFSLLLSGVGDAFAARLGGGKSFGSRPSYSQPYKRNNDVNQTTPAQQPAYQSPASQRNQVAREAMAKRGGLMGMLGGLALGGLLGAMLFGGAFEHINFLDILIFGAIAFMLFKLLAARAQTGSRQASAEASGYRPAGVSTDESAFHHPYERRSDESSSGSSERAGFDTDVLFKKAGAVSATTGFAPSVSTALPADFDAVSFLNGAKAAYRQLQASWDSGDLSDLRALTTDKVFAELQDQIQQRVGTNQTELLKVDAELLEVRDIGTEREASVLFDVILRESAEDRPTQVREIWHFVRPKASKQPTWFLDGLQQIED